MSILAKIPWLHRDSKTDDDEFRHVRDILDVMRPGRRSENMRFSIKNRGKSPASLFGREHLQEAVLHCVTTDDEEEHETLES